MPTSRCNGSWCSTVFPQGAVWLRGRRSSWSSIDAASSEFSTNIRKEAGAMAPASTNPLTRSRLLVGLVSGVHVVRHVGEGVAQRVAQRGHGADGSDSNESSDQAVFDRGCTFVVGEQVTEKLHVRSPRGGASFFPSRPILSPERAFVLLLTKD